MSVYLLHSEPCPLIIRIPLVIYIETKKFDNNSKKKKCGITIKNQLYRIFLFRHRNLLKLSKSSSESTYGLYGTSFISLIFTVFISAFFWKDETAELSLVVILPFCVFVVWVTEPVEVVNPKIPKNLLKMFRIIRM